MSSKANPAFFKPPPETLSIFDDFEDDDQDDEIEEEPEVSMVSQNQGFRALFDDLFIPRRTTDYPKSHRNDDRTQNQEEPRIIELDDDDEDKPAVFLNKSTSIQQGRRLPKYIRNPQYGARRQNIIQAPPKTQQTDKIYYRSPPAAPRRPARGHTVTVAGGGEITLFHNAFASADERKRREQSERIENVEAELIAFLDEFPADTKLRGRLLQIQAYKLNLKQRPLNPSEVRVLYEIGKIIERKKVANESKAFEKLAEATMGVGGGAFAGDKSWKGKKRAREDEVIPEYFPAYHAPTASPNSQNRKRQRAFGGDYYGEGHGDDFEEEEREGHPSYGGKTVPKGDLSGIERYDVEAVLKEEEVEEEEYEDRKTDNEGGAESSDDDESHSSSDTGGELEIDV